MNRKIRLALLIILQLAVMTAIFCFSSQQAKESQNLSDGMLSKLRPILALLPKIEDDEGSNIRKWAHIFEFMCLGASSFMLSAEIFVKAKKRFLISAVSSAAFCVLYAASDELHQYFVPGRACRLRDVFIDSSGAFFAIAVMTVIYLLINRKAGFLNNEQKPYTGQN